MHRVGSLPSDIAKIVDDIFALASASLGLGLASGTVTLFSDAGALLANVHRIVPDVFAVVMCPR